VTGEMKYIGGSDPEHSTSCLVCCTVNLQMKWCGNWQLITMCVLNTICTDYIITSLLC